MSKPEAIRSVTSAKHIFLMLYGEPGIGKTRFVGTSPRCLIVRPPTDHTAAIEDRSVDEWVVRDWQDMDEVLEYMRHDGAKEYDWVWLDSISLFQDTGLDDIWQKVTDVKPARKEHGLDKGEYLRNMTFISRWVRAMVGADAFNFGIVAHPHEGETLEGDSKLMPYVQGRNMSAKISGYMNMVLYMAVKAKKDEEPYLMIYSLPSDDYVAKDQWYSLPNGRLKNPTMPTLLKHIKAARSARGSTAPKPATTRRRRTAVRKR